MIYPSFRNHNDKDYQLQNGGSQLATIQQGRFSKRILIKGDGEYFDFTYQRDKSQGTW